MMRYIIGISILTIGIIIVRALSNGKVLRRHQYAFWIVIPLFMMLFPFIKFNIPITQVFDPVSFQKAETVTNIANDSYSPVAVEEKQLDQALDNQTDSYKTDNNVELIDKRDQITEYYLENTNSQTKNSPKTDNLIFIISYSVAAVLIIALLVHNACFILYCRCKREYVGKDLASGLKIYRIKNKGTPFLLLNKIYVESDSADINEYIICHETCHYKHGDHIWVLIRYLVLFLNWYNPVIWAAFILSGRDCELACDEEVLNVLGADLSKDYARTLLGMFQEQTNTATVFTLSTGMRDGYKTMKQRITNIKKPAIKSRKALALSIAAIMLFTSCSFVDTSKNIRKVAADTPWYECEKKQFDVSKVSTLAYYYDKSCCVFNKVLDETTGEYCSNLVIVDGNDEIHEIDVSKFFNEDEQFNIQSCFCKDGDCYAVYYVTKKGVNHNSLYKINDYSTLEYIGDFDSGKEDIYYVDRVIASNNQYYAHLYVVQNNSYNDAFCVFDSELNLVNEMRTDNPVVRWSLNKNSQIVTVEYDRSNIANTFYYSAVLDLENGLEKRTNVDSEVYENINLGYATDDGYCYKKNADFTITKINLETGEETVIVDLNYSSSNLFDLQCSSLVYCDEDTYIFQKDTTYPSESMNWTLFTLTKQESNPHVGKQLLYIAPNFNLGSMAASAIYRLNMTSQDTYAYVTMDYSRLTFTDYEKSDNSEISSYNKNISLISKLKTDISNGTGPDILLDFANYSSLNSSDYLYDLMGVINDKSKFNREDYFDNIFDAYAKNGKLYQMPVSACVGGIYALDTAVSDSKTGFTYTEYEDYVLSECGGFDPLEYNLGGRDKCFSLMVRSRYNDLFDTENHLITNNGVFSNICSYVRDMNENPDFDEANAERFVEFYRIHFDLSRRMLNENKQLFGLPSEDGSNGPIVFAYESIGICSRTSQFDKAFEFVKCILSYEVQIQNVVNNPVNREAFSYYAQDAILYAADKTKNPYGQSYEVDPAIIDEYIEYICSANTCYMCDDYALLIMNEELQPYYQHQKELDMVIPVIESRVNNLANEQH